MPTTGQIPLQDVIQGQTIDPTQWNNEMANISNLLDAQGAGGYSNTDPQMQVQTDPYPGGVTSHASAVSGELERLRYMIAQITGNPFWYQHPSTSISSLGNTNVPIGGVIEFPSATPPSSNWHLADGTAINRTTYASLFTLIGTTFGSGDGVSTFNLPNYTDLMSIGAGNLYALASNGGSLNGALSITDPGHTHTQNAHNHTDAGHTHSTPNHNHEIDYGTQAGVPGTTFTGNVITNDAGGNDQVMRTTQSGTGTATQRYYKTGTQTSGAGTSGSGSASINNATATNNSGTTGISGTAATLPPYLAMYKLIRVL